MDMSAVIYQKSSPYSNTPQVNQYIGYLDFWNGTYIFPKNTDIYMQLDAQYQYRPDLLSYVQYGTPQLWWIFMLRNPDVIKDPVWDFVANISIYVPQKSSLVGLV